MSSQVQRLHWALTSSMVMLAAFGALWFLMTGTDEGLVLALGGACGAVALAVGLVQRPYDPVSPPNFFALAVIFGVTLQTLYLTTAPEEIQRAVMFGHSVQWLFPGLLLVLFCVLCFGVGYGIALPKSNVRWLGRLSSRELDRRKLLITAIAFGIGASLALGLYLRQLGVSPSDLLSVDTISRKRRIVVEGADYRYAAGGYYIWGSNILGPLFLITWGYLVASRRSLRSVDGFVCLTLLVGASIGPLITSSRATIVELLLYAGIVWWLMRRTLPIRGIVMTGSIVLAIVISMGALRAVGQSQVEAVTEGLDPGAILEMVSGRGRGFSATKIARIMEGVPRIVEYQNGSTMVTWLVAPIPRVVWPGKPIIRVGPTIAQPLFGWTRNVTGIPPSLAGELWLNFGFGGVLAGMCLFGIAMRKLHSSFQFAENPLNASIYAVLLVVFGLKLPFGDVSGTIMLALQGVGTLVLVSWCVTRRRPSKHGRAEGTIDGESGALSESIG